MYPPPTHQRCKAKQGRRPSVAEPQGELNALRRELSEAREQQTTTADVLRIIGRSTYDARLAVSTNNGGGQPIPAISASILFCPSCRNVESQAVSSISPALTYLVVAMRVDFHDFLKFRKITDLRRTVLRVVFTSCLAGIGLLVDPSDAATLTGDADIIDGDTIRINGIPIRLYGIDAPESRQTCERDGKSYACGKTAS